MRWADNVVEESTTTTTLAYQLGGVPASGEAPGTQTFVAGIGDAQTCYYYAKEVSGTAWERGIGTVTDAATDTLTRTTIHGSSNAGSAVDWTGKTLRVYCVNPAHALRRSTLDHAGLLDNATFTVTRSGNAETFHLKTAAGNDPSAADPVRVAFANTTGGFDVLEGTSALSFTFSSGSTGGAVNSLEFNAGVLLLNNAGTLDMGAVVRPSGIKDNSVVSTTAEGGTGTADSSDVIYSAAALTNVRARVLGYATYTLAAVGTWDTAPTDRSLIYPLAQPLDATLTSLATLGTAAGKVAYTTGVDTWAETTLTAAGRALIDDANAADQRTTLGLGSIATQNSATVAITGGSITGITDLAIADGGTGSSTAANARTALGLAIGTDVQAYNANYARTDLVNTFVNGQIIQANNDAAIETIGFRLDRLSASPAAGDFLTSIRFSGRNSSAVLTEFVSLRPSITNIGAGTEAGQLEVLTLVNNTIGYCAVFADGVVLSAPTGGDKGRGTLNAVNLYVHGSAVLKQTDIFVSTDQTITLAGALTLAHGLGVAPRITLTQMVCQTAELGYSVGDVLVHGATHNIASIVPDATNLNVRYNSVVWSVVHKTTGVLTSITAANWKARFLAIK